MSQTNIGQGAKLNHSHIIGIQNQNLVRQNSYLLDELNKIRSRAANINLDPEEAGQQCQCSEQTLGFFFRTSELFKSLETAIRKHPVSETELGVRTAGVFGAIFELLTLTAKQSMKDNFSAGDMNSVKTQKDYILSNIDHICKRIDAIFSDDKAKESKLDSSPKEKENAQIIQFDMHSQIFTQISELEDKVASLKWKNHILEKRLAFGQNALLQHDQSALERFVELPDMYCYCGGKFLKELYESHGSIEEIEGDENRGAFLNSIVKYLSSNEQFLPLRKAAPSGIGASADVSRVKEQSSLRDQFLSMSRMVSETPPLNVRSAMESKMEIEEMPVANKPDELQTQGIEKALKDQIAELQKSNQELLELAESRRVDRLAGVKLFTETNLFMRISEENAANLEMIQSLERKLLDSATLLSDIEELRRKELSEVREKMIREREKLQSEISNLKSQLADAQLKIELKSIESDKRLMQPGKPAEGQNTAGDITILLQKVYQAIKTVIFKLNQTIAAKDKTISDLETAIELKKAGTAKHGDGTTSAEAKPVLKNQHHEELFSILKIHTPPEIHERLNELHKYLKTREDKIRGMSKELNGEKATSANLLGEIANSCTAYQLLRTEADTLKAELVTAQENFNLLYKEKQTEKASFAKKISDLEAALLQANEKAASRLSRQEIYAREYKESELNLRAQTLKSKEALSQLEQVIRDKNEANAKVLLISGEKELLEHRVQALEVSQKKLATELAESITEVAKSKALQSQLLEIIDGKRLLPGGKDEPAGSQTEEPAGQRGQILLQQLEMNDLKV